MLERWTEEMEGGQIIVKQQQHTDYMIIACLLVELALACLRP